MASGGEANWRVARDEGLQRTLLGILCKWLEAQDMGEKDLAEIPEGQPLRLRLLRRLLESVGDPDREFLRDGEDTRCQAHRTSSRSSYAGHWTISPGSPG